MKYLTSILTVSTALLFLGAGSTASASPMAMSSMPAIPQTCHPNWHKRWHHSMRPGFNPLMGAVFADLRAIRKLSMLSGDRAELVATYQHILASTQNPILRNYAYLHLARLQLHVSNSHAALATLRKSLDENLVLLNKRRQDRQAPAAK